MGKQSTRENKTFYQICREEAGLTRSEASEKMTAVSDSKIEKFEYEMQEPTPYDKYLWIINNIIHSIHHFRQAAKEK